MKRKLPSRREWQRYVEIKKLIEDYWQLQEGKRYDDFVRKLLQVLDL
jgi:hypothetical protein